LFYRLRKFRKRQFFCFIVCGSSASAKFFVLTFAEAPQAFQKSILSSWKVDKRMAECFYGQGSCMF